MRLVALKATFQIGLFVDLLVGTEGLIFPFAVAEVVGVLRALAGAFFHHGVGDKVALHEAALGILRWIAGGIELRLVLDQG